MACVPMCRCRESHVRVWGGCGGLIEHEMISRQAHSLRDARPTTAQRSPARSEHLPPLDLSGHITPVHILCNLRATLPNVTNLSRPGASNPARVIFGFFTADMSAAPRPPANASRAPNGHRVHSSCDRCRSRKTKVSQMIFALHRQDTLIHVV